MVSKSRITFIFACSFLVTLCIAILFLLVREDFHRKSIEEIDFSLAYDAPCEEKTPKIIIDLKIDGPSLAHFTADHSNRSEKSSDICGGLGDIYSNGKIKESRIRISLRKFEREYFSLRPAALGSAVKHVSGKGVISENYSNTWYRNYFSIDKFFDISSSKYSEYYPEHSEIEIEFHWAPKKLRYDTVSFTYDIELFELFDKKEAQDVEIYLPSGLVLEKARSGFRYDVSSGRERVYINAEHFSVAGSVHTDRPETYNEIVMIDIKKRGEKEILLILLSVILGTSISIFISAFFKN